MSRDVMQLRGAVVRGAVVAVDDGGQAQRLAVETHEGVLRTEVEVVQAFGVASRAPAGPGAVAVLLAVGGDQGDMVALPVACPSVRFGALQPGETVIYDAEGNRVHLRAGGVVELRAATAVRVQVGATVLEVSAGGVAVTGDLTVSGQISDAAGSLQEMRDRYNGHTHAGGAPPSTTMD